MPHSLSLIMLLLSGVCLLVWYGVSRLREAPEARLALPDAGTPEYSRIARTALRAEFRNRLAALHRPSPGGNVWCVECGAEHPTGTPWCPCGGVTSEAEDPEHDPETASDPDEYEDQTLVCVAVAESSWKATLLRSLLEADEIACRVVTNARGCHDLAGMEEARILVSCQEAQRARMVLRQHV